MFNLQPDGRLGGWSEEMADTLDQKCFDSFFWNVQNSDQNKA